MIDVQEFFDAVREAATSRAWSRGIELARGDAVDGVDHDEDSVTLRVQQPGKTVALTVSLFLLDEEWVCDCSSREAVCQHVTAATIALRRARKEGKSMPSAASPGAKVGYRLGVDDGRLTVARVAVTDDGETPIEKSVGSVLAGTSSGPELAVDEVDLTIDRMLQMRRTRNWNPESLPSLFKLLAQADDVAIAGESVKVSTDWFGPRVLVREKGKGYVLCFEAPKTLREVAAQGVGLVEGEGGLELRLLDFAELAGTRWERLPADMSYPPHRAAELVGTVLPDLRQRAEVVVQTKRLPERVGRLEPRIVLEVEQRGSSLSVLPTLVYGDPPCARVDDGRLVHLGGPVPRRDRRGEQRVAEELRERLDGVVGRRLERTGAGAVELAQELRSYGGSIFGEAHLSLYPEALPPHIDVDGRRVDVAFGEDGAQGADARDVVSAWQRGAKTVMLRGGGWAPLPEAWLAAHGQRLMDLLTAQRADGEVEAHAEPVVADLCQALERPVPPGFDRLRPLLKGFEGLPSAPLPADLTAELRSYQRRGVDWLSFLRDAGLGGLLADDMGLGKTLQALCAIDGRTLVVCPRSVVHNWVDEIERFRPDLRFSVYHGASRELDPEADVTLTTYALLRNDVEALSDVSWRAVILDEAQAIKNPESQVTRAAYRLKAEFRLTLSGTPVENRLEELWSQMHFVNPGLLGGRKAFDERFGVPIAAGQPGVAAHLRDRIRPFLLRRVKDEVLSELPPRTDAVMHCELDDEEREVYDAVLAATRRDVLDRLSETHDVLGALEALLRLRQAACDAALVPGQTHLVERDGRPRASSKVRRLQMALEEVAAEGRRALVFSQWTSLLDRVEPHLEREGIGFCRLDGSTTDREGVVRTFQAEDGPPVMLLSLKAGGTGLNLTAADHVFLLDPWWNPAVEDQAADRAHRIGQERPVMVYRLVARETVEERILALQAEKRSLAEAALGEADRAAGLTRADLEALLA